MPSLPENIRPSYLPPRKKQERRRFNNPWYHTTRWRKLRAFKLSNDPLCEECERHGITTVANTVDHIDKVSSGQTEQERERLMWDYDNTQSICSPCHNSKSGKEAHQ